MSTGTARAGLVNTLRAYVARPQFRSGEQSEGGVRVFDSDVAVPYTAAGSTYTWCADLYSRDGIHIAAGLTAGYDLMTLYRALFYEPGHFHATLTLRTPNPRLAPDIHV